MSWELIEPEEGRFDFTLVDGLIQEARRRQVRLVFLWFGSWNYDHLEPRGGIETSAADSLDDRIISAWTQHAETLSALFPPA